MNTKYSLLAIVVGLLLGACALAQPVDQTSSGMSTPDGTASSGGMSVTEHTSSGTPTPNGIASSDGTSVANGTPTPNGTASSGGTNVPEQTPSGTPTPNGTASSGGTSVAMQTSSGTLTPNGAAGSGGTGVAIRNASGAPATNALYVVQGGDSLEMIAQKYGVPVEWIVQRNLSSYPCLKDNLNCLKTGAVILVPRLSTLTIEMPVDGSDFRDLRVAIMNGVNQYRRENKLPALAWDEGLATFTQNRSVDMAKRNYFDHFDPVTGAALADGAGRNPACENIFLNKGGSVQSTAVPWWINSPAHRACMLKDYAKVIGIGVSKDGQGIWYATMIAAN